MRHPPPLVSVRHLSLEVAAGWGSAACQVRVLDDLSLAVPTGQLVLLRASPASGLSALWAALAGARLPPGSERLAHAALAVRRGTVPTTAVATVAAAWDSVPGHPAPPAPVLWLLRAGGRVAGPRPDGWWSRWAAHQRRAGHAVVIGQRMPWPMIRRRSADPDMTNGVVREGSRATPSMRSHGAGPAGRGAVRHVRLVAGRLVSDR